MWDELRGDTLAPYNVYETFAISLQRLGVGMAIAMVLGTIIGLGMGLSRKIDALFNAAGLPGPPFPDVDTMLVNFAAPRHLTSCVAPHMTDGGAICSISSTAGSGYLLSLEKWMPLVDTPDFASAKAWCEEHPDDIVGAYAQSKEALIIWTMKAAMDLNAQGIRLNCISPGPTDTPMMPAFEDMAGGDGKLIDLFAQGLGRRSTPAEQGWPMIFLNSDAASYISGENLNTDGGTVSAITTGRLVLEFDLSAFDQS